MYHEHLMCVTLCVCVCVTDNLLSGRGCWLQPFQIWVLKFSPLTLPCPIAPLLGYSLVLKLSLEHSRKASSRGIRGWQLPCSYSDVLEWTEGRCCPCDAWTLVLIGLAIKDVKWCWGTHNKPLLSTHQHIHVRFPPLGCLFPVRK